MCVVGFDSGPDPRLGKYECRIKHSSNAVTKTLSSLLSAAHEDGNRQAEEAGFEPQDCMLEELFRPPWTHV